MPRFRRLLFQRFFRSSFQPLRRLGGVLAMASILGVMAPRGLAADVVAFVHVNVIPMDQETVRADQTVVVRDGAIVASGPAATVAVPAGAQVVTAPGAFLLPGLADLHTHSQHPDDLALYVVHGVTTMLNLGLSWPSFVTSTRARIAAGELLGPNCFVAPMMNGARGSDLPCATVAAAQDSVRLAKEQGYEFIKVYNDLSKPLFHALVEEAHAQGLAVVGHGVRAPGLEESFAAGQVMLAHGEEYLYTILAKPNGFDANRVPDAVALTRQYGVSVIPNLSAYEAIQAQWGKPAVVDQFLARPQTRAMRPYWRRKWKESAYVQNRGSLDGRLEFLRTLTKALHDGGVRLLLGTDSPDIPGVQAGFSIHDDLRNLVAAGLTPFQAIECGTRWAGEFIGEFVPDADPFGTVAVGQRADLMLVETNPLEDVARLRDPLGVMVHGRWHSRDELKRVEDGLIARFERIAGCEGKFLEDAAANGDVAACQHLRDERARAGTAVELDETTLNERIYELVRAGGLEAALDVARLNTELHPTAPNCWDTLADVQRRSGQLGAAKASLRQELALDPKNVIAARALKEIPGE